MVEKEIIIIGAGASGLMAAGRYNNNNLLVLEGNPKIARKIEISGGGRCNITNRYVSSNNYLGESVFVQKVLKSYSQNDLLRDLKAKGLSPVLRKTSQYFCPKSAGELVDVLGRSCQRVKIYTQHKVLDVQKEDLFIVTTDQGKFAAKKLVVASGGLSFPSIGATDIAYRIAEYFGHRVVYPKPALVGLTLQKEQFWMKALSGVSLPVKITLEEKQISGDMLFAHRGISGPAVLNSSLYWEKGKIEIDFVPHRKLDKSFFQSKKQVSTALGVPKRFAKAFLDVVGVRDQPLYLMKLQDRQKLKAIKSYVFAPAGNFGFAKAEVTRGGIATDEINVETMMSKKCEGLYFLGESLDVTGELGGYNFQWAFATAQRLQLYI